MRATYGAPQLTLHRRDLLAVIASGLPSERIHLSHRLTNFAEQGDSVEAWFDNGAHISVDVLVGADGIHSTVQAGLFGNEAPVFAGCVAYRGLVPIERIADLGLDHSNQSWVGPGAHFVHYFVSRGRLLNFVGWTEHDTWNREDWTDRATVDRALAAFAGWHPQVGRIIGAAETCHPMYPFMGQGAAQAIEDGATLAACLAVGRDDPVASLQRYEQLRIPRVSRLQAMSRANKTRFHMPDGPAQQARDAEWGRAGDRAPDNLRWLYDHDPAALT